MYNKKFSNILQKCPEQLWLVEIHMHICLASFKISVALAKHFFF